MGFLKDQPFSETTIADAKADLDMYVQRQDEARNATVITVFLLLMSICVVVLLIAKRRRIRRGVVVAAAHGLTASRAVYAGTKAFAEEVKREADKG